MVCTFCINKLKSDWNPSIELNFQEQIVVLKDCDNYSGLSLILSSLQVFSLSVDVVNMFLWLFFFCNKNNNMYLSQLVCLHHRENSRWSDLSRNIQLQAERLSVIVKWQFLQKKREGEISHRDLCYIIPRTYMYNTDMCFSAKHL